MTQTKKETVALLTPWAAQCGAIHAAYEPLDAALNLAPENAIHNALWSTFDAYTDTLAALIGDKDDWLQWYCHENGMGIKAHPARARAGKRLRKICNLADLARLVLESRA